MLAIIDFETTGVDAGEDAVVEVAVQTYDVRPDHDGRMGLYGPFWEHTALTDPQRSIPPAARAVHHIGPADVAGQPTWEHVRNTIIEPAITGHVKCAHHAEFDRKFYAGEPSELWICTRIIAHHLCWDAPSLQNQVLRYHLGIEIDTGLHPHRALADVRVTAAVLHNMLRRASDDPELYHDPIAWMTERMDTNRHPVLMKTFSFGKHKGIEITKVPRDYLKWVVEQGAQFDNQEALVTARHALAGRFHPALMQQPTRIAAPSTGHDDTTHSPNSTRI